MDTLIARGDKFSLNQCHKNDLEIEEMGDILMLQQWEVLCILKFIRVQILRMLLGC